MTPRARRLLAAAIVVVLLLFTGRWLAEFTTVRWWAAAISPAAHAAVTRWQLLGLALDAAAVCVASLWFAAQALLVARAIGSVQVQRQVGDTVVRQVVPMRWLVLGAVSTGVLLGLFTGAGARAWRAPLLLALNRPTYGITDPLLGVDLGVLVASYPVWRAAHGFALVLVILGLVLTLVLYASIGAIKRVEGRLDAHPDARRHLGGLLAMLAVVISAGYLLAPYRLATSIDVPLAAAAASTRVLAAHAAAGAALAAAGLSIAWLIRARHSLLISGWMVLALAAISERLVVPAFVAEAGSTVERVGLERQFDSVFHHLSLAEGSAVADTLPPVMPIWDEAAVTAWAAERGQTVLGLGPQGTSGSAEWLIASARDSAPDQILLTRIVASRTDDLGRPIVVDSGHAAVVNPRSIPGASGWHEVTGGVRVGRFLRPIAIAWAQQAPGVLGIGASATIDWDRDPRERAEALVPALTWQSLGAAHIDGRLVWLLSGLATVPRAPLATRVAFAGRTVSGVVPSLIAVVTAESGAVAFYPDPSADALGQAWTRAFRGIVSPLDDMPTAVRDGLGYPREWFDAQLEVLSRAQWGMGVLPRLTIDDEPGLPAAVWAPGPGALQQAMEDPERRQTVHILTARRLGGEASIRVDRLPAGAFPASAQLIEAWQQAAPVGQLMDSIRAAGDVAVTGPIRWYNGASGMLAWQVVTSSGRQGPLRLLWVGTATSHRLGGARRPNAAWESVLGPQPDGSPVGTIDELARMEAVRSWMRRADSALIRGDLTAFARSWEALRGLLLDSLPE